MINYSSIQEGLKALKKLNLFIDIKTIESPIGPKIKINGKWLLNFCSNNYLGLANDKRIKKAAKQAIDKYGIGTSAVRTIAGTSKLHNKLESQIAKFKKVEDVITFQSGFNANLATIPAFVKEGDLIFSDELNHASIIDACRLSKANIIVYKHKDVDDLRFKIKKQKSKTSKKLIVTDGVFSMDGDIAPLDEIAKIAKEYQAILMVDDAHGEGVLGENGRGIVSYFNLHGKVDIEAGTMSKAFAVVGGYVAGNKILINWLRQKARPFLFSSAMTIPDVAACIEAIKILQRSKKLVKKLWQNTFYFKEKIKTLGFDTGESQTPIIPIILGKEELTKKFSQELFKNGVFATAIGYPTVPEGKARIRLIISAAHDQNDLDKALEIFGYVGKKLGLIY